MFKQLVLSGVLFTTISCGQNNASSIKTTGSSDTLTKNDTQKTTINSTGTANAQTAPGTDKQDTSNLPPALSQFIPQGYAILDTANGDLNLDQYPDVIMILKKNGEDSTSDVVNHPEKRPLLILTGQADKSYKLAARSDNAVYCVNCGGSMGDPYQDVVINKGYFSIEHYGGSSWRWTRTITFKYSPSDNYWYLHKDGGDSFNASDPDKVKTTVKTTKNFGKVPFYKFDIYKED